MLTLYELLLVLSMYLTLCHANSAGTGIPCGVLDTPSVMGNFLGHPKRGDLQQYQDAIDAATNAEDKKVREEERVEHMKKLKDEGYVMEWTLPPVHSTSYSVRTGDGATGDDPTEYTPGSWMNIYVRALEEGKKFTGLVMNAADAQGKVVGHWQFDPNSAFRYGEESGGRGCVTHRNADLKHYRNVFRLKIPASGVGSITIRAMVKVGLAFPVLDGSFFFPNTQHLTLTEGTVQVQRWFEGAPGQSCDQVCSKQGMNCDLATLSSVGSSRTEFYKFAQAFSPSCIEPIMAGCGKATPSVGSEGCFFHDRVCGEKPVLPPVIRKDPCEMCVGGVTSMDCVTRNVGPQGSWRLQAGECVRWTYQQQNNGVGNTYWNKLYNRGDDVKVCNAGTNEGEFKDQDRLGDPQGTGMIIRGKCAPEGGFTSSPTPMPPPPKEKGDTTCSATDNDLTDGGRICACSGGSGKPNVPDVNDPDYDPNNPNPPDSSPNDPSDGVTRSSPNMALVGAIILLTSMNQLDTKIPKLLSILSLALSVNAHNWMSSPSRANNNFNAYQTAPCPPKGSRVHFQVGAGQKFPMEFATGHSTPARGGTYLTVLRAEDEGQMIKHTRALLDDYIASVPTAAPPYMADFKSHHVGSTAASTTTVPVNEELASLYGVGVTAANIRNYGPNWANKPGRGASIYPKKSEYTKDDIRVSYKSDKYPWIIAVHKFKLHEDKSEEADLVMMEIPVGSAVGQYVVQYSWNGYYDCTDVNVISVPSTDFYGEPAGSISFDKLDHCLWNPTYQGYTVLGQCQEIKEGDSLEACESQCKQINGCYGVQVVPYKLPKELSDMNRKGLFQGRTSTMPAKCNLQNAADDSLVCFPLMQGQSVVGSTYDISNDPYDSIFYGTCYIKGGAWKFDQAGPGAADVPKTDEFKFGGQECISCDSMRNSKVDGVVPFWKVTFGECEHCDRTLG